MVNLPIYLDNNATTRTDPRVVQAMLPYFTEEYGNAASKTHEFGHKAAEAVEQARGEVAALIGASPREIIFTSGATESDNLALKGAAALLRPQGNHIITAQTEHKAVLDTCKRLQQNGFAVTYLPVDRFGHIDVAQLADALTEKTILVSLMTANNEIGTLHPLAKIGKLCKERGVLFHTDAAQAVGKVTLDVEALGIDLLSLSGHKLYGPKGIGVLYVRRRDPHVRLEPQIDGGGHERGLRSGTLPVPLVVGLGRACVLGQEEMPQEAERLRALRDRLASGLLESLEGVTLNGHPDQRLPNTVNLSFAHVQSEALLMALRSVAASSGSACTSANVEPSHVLRAIGLPDDLARGSVRFGLGRFTTQEEIDFVVGEVVRVVERLRAFSPSYALAASD
jgi:cysteine desulfurase